MTDKGKGRHGVGAPNGLAGRNRVCDCVSLHAQHSRSSAECKAPLGTLPATIQSDGMIYVAGRHLCRVKGDALMRTFNPKRELLKGGLSFRIDVLKLAFGAGTERIVATERGTKRHWIISKDDLVQHGWKYKNAKFGEQWVCDLKYWTLVGERRNEQPELFAIGVAQ